jgi:F0F1-type ATP synthase assembly protein I
MKPDTNSQSRKRAWIQYAGAGMQMVVIVLGMTWLGHYLDTHYALETPWWTLSLSLLGCVLGLYYMVKSFLK